MHAKMLDVQDNHKLSASTTLQVTSAPTSSPSSAMSPLCEGTPPA